MSKNTMFCKHSADEIYQIKRKVKEKQSVLFNVLSRNDVDKDIRAAISKNLRESADLLGEAERSLRELSKPG